MVIQTLSDRSLKSSVEFLSGLDQDWENLIKKIGSCHLKKLSTLSPYESLLKTIAYQQLHAKAAETIFQRFLSQFNGHFPKALELLEIDPMLIKQSGFSQTKTETLLRIAEASIKKIIPDQKEIKYLNDDEISKLYHQLVEVNSKLWEVEDELRVIESTKDFNSEFIELARKVYYTNDERFSLKNKINELTNSEVREQKDYIEYK